MRRLLLPFLLIPAAAAAQLGTPMSSMPGVHLGTTTPAGGASPGAIQGVVIPQERLNRLLGAPAGGTPAGAKVGEEIERAFYGSTGSERRAAEASFGLTGGAAQSISGSALKPAREQGVTSNGVGVTLPASQSLVPSTMVPGAMTVRPTGAADSPTGVSNLFTGTGRPRAGDLP